MQIVLIENSKKIYDGHSRNNFELRGAELAIINYSEELVKKGNHVTVLNNCKREILINGVYYKNINDIKSKFSCDVAIVNSDANYFKYVDSKKNFLLSHSIQNFEKFVRNKQFVAFIKYKPTVLCFSKYQYDKRNFITSLFGKKIIIPSIDNDFYSFKLQSKINQNAIFYSRFDRNGKYVIDIWKKIFPQLNNNSKLYINSEFSKETDLNKYNIKKKAYMEKNKLIEFLSNFRILIIPGHKGEVFCNVAEEAKALCIPIVTLGIGALKERVINNYNGYVCNSFLDFEEKILTLMNNDEIYMKFKKNLFKDRGSRKWEDTVNKLIDLFN
tara:strand:- start:392 stop:1375 length:984 start_codon:yes stop_codon:yes gene_type:complete